MKALRHDKGATTVSKNGYKRYMDSETNPCRHFSIRQWHIVIILDLRSEPNNCINFEVPKSSTNRQKDSSTYKAERREY